MATNTISSHAAAAKKIRQTLKAAFPGVTFRVQAKSYSGGDSVHIAWIDGPTETQVDRLVADFEYGHFDPMIDLYEYDNRRDDIPQVKFVMTRREMSRQFFTATLDLINRRYGWNLVMEDHGDWFRVDPESDQFIENGGGFRSHYVHRFACQIGCACEHCHATNLLPGDKFCPECGTKTPDLPSHL